MKRLITIVLAIIMALFVAPNRSADQPPVTAVKTPQTAITAQAEQAPEGSGKPAETAFVSEVKESELITEVTPKEESTFQETVTEECTEVTEETITETKELCEVKLAEMIERVKAEIAEEKAKLKEGDS